MTPAAVLDPVLLGFVLLGITLAVGYFVFSAFLFGAGYQPTPRRSVLTMLRFAEVTERDTVYDLGAGTGAIVFRAARGCGARVLGVEVEPIRFAILKLRRALGPAGERIALRWGNLFHLDFAPASVVTAFLWPGAMARLRPKFESELREGARVVSHCHAVPGWTYQAYDRESDVYLYRWPEARGGRVARVPVTDGT